ncbi:MAG: zinc carboxypeptidase [Chitinispirillaceae bacterium]|nr:zinc carboxypeptidase [Chitinispirillaceae bacterium]
MKVKRCCLISLLIFAPCVFAGGNFGAYPTFREIDSALTALQTRYPQICKRSVLSEKSYQGRDIFLVKISNSPNALNQRPQALISGLQHADEPIGGIMCLRDMEYLCENYGTDDEATWLVNNRQIWFVPIMCPDRYVWNESITTIRDRKRKTMHIASGLSEAAGGVDPNRNYPFKWGYDNTGSSSTPSASNYRGTAALSEPETRAMVDFVASHKIRTWQNHHASGDYLILPYGYRGAGHYPPDSAIYFTMAREQQKFYPYKKIGNSGDCYGSWILNGGTDDWGTSDSAKYGKDYKVYCIITEIGADGSYYWDYWDNRAKLLARCDTLLGADLYMIKCAGFYPVIRQIEVQDNASGNNNGILNPGETAQVVVTIENKSVVDTTPNVRAVLATAYQNAVIADSSGNFGSVRLLAQARNNADPFTVSCLANARESDIILFDLKVRWTMNSVDFEKALPCTLRVGRPTAVAKGKKPVSNGALAVTTNARRQIVIRFNRSPFSAEQVLVRIYSPIGSVVNSTAVTLSDPVKSVCLDGIGKAGAKGQSGLLLVEVTAGETRIVKKVILR